MRRVEARELEAAPDGGGVGGGAAPGVAHSDDGPASYRVTVNGKIFDVEVAPSGRVTRAEQITAPAAPKPIAGNAVSAALAGNVFKVLVNAGDRVQANQPIIVLEAMKMETEVSAPAEGVVSDVYVSVGDAVQVGDPLVSID